MRNSPAQEAIAHARLQFRAWFAASAPFTCLLFLKAFLQQGEVSLITEIKTLVVMPGNFEIGKKFLHLYHDHITS